MATFRFEATNAQGRNQHGEIDASSRNSAFEKLIKSEFVDIELSETVEFELTDDDIVGEIPRARDDCAIHVLGGTAVWVDVESKNEKVQLFSLLKSKDFECKFVNNGFFVLVTEFRSLSDILAALGEALI